MYKRQVEECAEDTLQKLESLATSSEKVMAIGEIGLDYYWIFKIIGGDKAQKPARDEAFEIQKKYFIAQLDLAHKLNKSVIIHCRQAKKRLLQILEHHWEESFRNRMVFHCCEPDLDLLNFAQAKGIYIGVDGDITYNLAKQEFIKNVPLDMLVLETDAPFLTPEPVRQTVKFPNEPANMKYIAQSVADLKNISLEEVVIQTTGNAKSLFNIV